MSDPSTPTDPPEGPQPQDADATDDAGEKPTVTDFHGNAMEGDDLGEPPTEDPTRSGS